MRKLELLAPARDLACGLAAIDHGADAVYIGAEHFGARAAAGNSLADIAALCTHAHRFGARVYVTVNTIVYEQELAATRQLVTDLSRIGVDAMLVQDMGMLELRREALAGVGRAPLLHASTQCDTRSAEKVEWLRRLGFARAVLARELSLEEIEAIHKAVPDIELEVFVHGALCVSYSGVCYASQHCFGRSANRGACAQFCRMRFDLVDADGHVVEQGRHLLSMKDMSQLDHLEELADAGATSFKIEGRLKDEGYVKNVVSAFSRRLDELVARHPQRYARASRGRVAYSFEPNLQKTFNRGFTTYFLKGRQPDIASFDTPKALGEFVGRVKELRRDSFSVAGTAAFANGDGLCFMNEEHELEGFRVNRAVGNRLYPLRMPRGLKAGTGLYRNNDEAFERVLAGATAQRTLPVRMWLGLTPSGFRLRVWPAPAGAGTSTPPDGLVQAGPEAGEPVGEATVDFAHEAAKSAQTDNIRRQLGKLGGTLFSCDGIGIDDEAAQLFIPSSLLAALRREAVEHLAAALEENRGVEDSPNVDSKDNKNKENNPNTDVEDNIDDKNNLNNPAKEAAPAAARVWQPEYRQFPYLYNVSNHLARDFYAAHGLSRVGPAFELEGRQHGALLMQCRHCLRYALGFCVRHGGRKPTWREPLVLRLGDGRRFRLEFRCDECQMNIYSE